MAGDYYSRYDSSRYGSSSLYDSSYDSSKYLSPYVKRNVSELQTLFYKAIVNQDDASWIHFNSQYHVELNRGFFSNYYLYVNKKTINYINTRGETIFMMLFSNRLYSELISLINRFKKYIINIDNLFHYVCCKHDPYPNFDIPEIMLSIFKDKCFNIEKNFSEMFTGYSGIHCSTKKLILKIISIHSNNQEIIKKFFFYCKINHGTFMTELFDMFNRETIIENFDVIIDHLFKHNDETSIITIIKNYNEVVISNTKNILINIIKNNMHQVINYITENSTDANMECFIKYIETINQTELNELLIHSYYKRMNSIVIFIIKILGENMYLNINEIMKNAIRNNMEILADFIIKNYYDTINICELLQLQSRAQEYEMGNVIIFMIKKYEDYKFTVNLLFRKTKIPKYIQKYMSQYLNSVDDLRINDILFKSVSTKNSNLENVVSYIFDNYKDVIVKNMTFYSMICRKIKGSARFDKIKATLSKLKATLSNPSDTHCVMEKKNNVILFSALDDKDECKILSLIQKDELIINCDNIDYVFTKAITSNLSRVFRKITENYSHLCNPGSINKKGNTPLIMACTSRLVEIIYLLVDTFGIKTLPKHENKKGVSAISIIESDWFYVDKLELKNTINKLIS
jgi:hypothetical protein